jgi:probable phosphoglycerate mutase
VVFRASIFVRFPDGESFQDIVLRSANALRRIVDAFSRRRRGLRRSRERQLGVAYSALLDQPLSAYWRIEQDPCAINVVGIERRGVRVITANDTFHLRSSP